jgi:hypothetical protein
MAEPRIHRTDRPDHAEQFSETEVRAPQTPVPGLTDTETAQLDERDQIEPLDGGLMDEADWWDQHVPPAADVEGAAADAPHPLTGQGSDADRIDQITPADPASPETGPTDEHYGSEIPAVDEADWWEQHLAVPGTDDDYPRDADRTR